jgi:putative spermidine/putrescine transport system permease protein
MGNRTTFSQPVSFDIPAATHLAVDAIMTKFFKWGFLVLLALFFVVPLLAMARFAFQSVPVALLTGETWLKGWSIDPIIAASTEPAMWSAARTSALLAVFTIILTLVLLLPLAIVTEIKAPRMRPWLTALTLLPWVVPPIALVVGVSVTFRTGAPWFLASVFSLVPFYALWAMPFTYRALDAGLQAINARTLYEAARSTGASFPTIILRVILPNMKASIVAAAALTTALVLGEFAFASLLLKETLPTFMVNFQQSQARAGLALALIILIFTALAIGIVVRTLRRRGLNIQTTGL